MYFDPWGLMREHVNLYISTQTPEEDYLAIYNHQADNSCQMCPFVLSGYLKELEVCSYIVIHDT